MVCVCVSKETGVGATFSPPPSARGATAMHPSRLWKPTFNECISLRSGCRRPPPPLQQKGA